jgi:hypothetical protein
MQSIKVSEPLIYPTSEASYHSGNELGSREELELPGLQNNV